MSRGIVPRIGQSQRMVTAALSIVALVSIVVAVPIGLLLVGGSPLGHWGYEQARQALASRQHVDPRVVTHWFVRGALILAWISWAWMAVCVALEVRSWVTGRSSARLPASRTLQSIAACLVGTALAMSTISREATVPRAPTGIAGATSSALAGVVRIIDDVPPEREPLPAAHYPGRSTPEAFRPDDAPVAVDPGRSPAIGMEGEPVGPDPTPRADPTTSPQTGLRPGSGPDSTEPRRSVDSVHTVMPRDTLWSIAANRLGSALRWKEIAELNYGATQPDGHVLTEQHWIAPGWRLALPDAPDRHPGGRTGRSDTGTARVPVGGPPKGWDDVRSDVEAPIAGAATNQPVRTHAGGDRTIGTDNAHDAHNGGPAAPIVPVGGGILGVGVVDLIDRMRRVQQRHRRGGSYIRLPDRARRRFEQRLRAGDGSDTPHAIDRSLRLLFRSWSGTVADWPTVKGVRIVADSIELLIDDVESLDRIPEPFTISDDGASLRLERTSLPGPARRDRSLGGRRSPAPTLVTAGQSPEGLILVNVEFLGSLVVNGDPSGCEGVLRALTLELATSYWADQFELVLVGFGAEFERFDRISTVVDVPSLVHRLCHRRLSGEALLQATGFDSFARARSSEDLGRWDPLVVICGPATVDDDVVELLEVGSDPRGGTSVIAVGTQDEADHALTLSGAGRWSSLELLGSVILPQRIEAGELADVGAVLDAAADLGSVAPSEAPYAHMLIPLPAPAPAPAVAPAPTPTAAPAPTPTPAPAPTPVLDRSPVAFERAPGFDGLDVRAPATNGFRAASPKPEDGSPEVEVSVLGQIGIRGAAREFTRAWAKELVVYLAMHANGASNEAWATALWPDRLMAPSSLHSTASVARRALGQGRDGLDHLPRSHGRLALARTVGTDWDRFVVLADSDRLDSWRSALQLVRGRPFEGLRSSDWPILEGIGPAIESSVVDLSGRLSGACLGAGDPRGAEWAARKGLLVSPYDERLYRMLMRAADLGGNPAGVEAVMAELIRLVADDIEPLDSVHPNTMALYRSLTRRRVVSVVPG